MVSTYKEIVTIRSGGLIEIRNPDLPEGSTAEVTVTVNPALIDNPEKPLSRFFGKITSSFNNCQEADAFLRAERDAWRD